MNPLESGLRYKWNPNTGFEVPPTDKRGTKLSLIGAMILLIGCSQSESIPEIMEFSESVRLFAYIHNPSASNLGIPSCVRDPGTAEVQRIWNDTTDTFWYLLQGGEHSCTGYTSKLPK